MPVPLPHTAREQLHQPCPHLSSTCVLHSAKPNGSLLPLSQCSHSSLCLGFLVLNSSRTNTAHPSELLSNADPCETMPNPSPPDGRPAPSCLPFSPHRLLTRSFCLCFACKSRVPSSFLPSREPIVTGNASICWLQKKKVAFPGAQEQFVT